MIDFREEEREYVLKLLVALETGETISEENKRLLRCYDDLKNERLYGNGGIPRSAIFRYYTNNSNITSQFGTVERFSNLIEEIDIGMANFHYSEFEKHKYETNERLKSAEEKLESLSDYLDSAIDSLHEEIERENHWTSVCSDTVFNVLFGLNLLVMTGVFLYLL